MPETQSPRTTMAGATATTDRIAGEPVGVPPVALEPQLYVWGDPLPDRKPRSWRQSAGLVAVAVVAAAGATYLVTTNGAGTTGTGPRGGFPGGSQSGGQNGGPPDGTAQVGTGPGQG